MRRAGPMARPFASILLSFSCNRRCNSQPLLFPHRELPLLLHRIPFVLPPDFPSRSSQPPSSPHSYLAVPKTFLLLGQPIGASFRFTLIDAFSQMLLLLLFIPFVFSFFPFFYVISFQSPHPIDTSPYILRENCRLYRLRPQNSFFFSIPSPPTRFQPVFSPPIISFFCIRELFRELDSGREKIIGFIVNAIADIRGSALSRPRVP